LKHGPSRTIGALVVACAASCALPAHAAAIYRWVDASGRTHVSDVVPEAYRKSAVRTDSAGAEIPAEQRKEAEQAAARSRALAEAIAVRRQGVDAPPPRATASPPTASKRPAEGVTDATSCERWRELYRESMACFAPFRTANGSTKAEGFEQCNPVPSPEARCGPLSD